MSKITEATRLQLAKASGAHLYLFLIGTADGNHFLKVGKSSRISRRACEMESSVGGNLSFFLACVWPWKGHLESRFIATIESRLSQHITKRVGREYFFLNWDGMEFALHRLVESSCAMPADYLRTYSGQLFKAHRVFTPEHWRLFERNWKRIGALLNPNFRIVKRRYLSEAA